MESIRCEGPKVWHFPLLSGQTGPHMADMDEVVDWEFEVDAIRYSVSHALRTSRGLTQMQLADDMRWSRANLTKVLQDQAAMPRETSLTFTEHTNCLALQQFRNLSHGLITKSIKQERDDQALLESLTQKNAELEAEIAVLDRKYRRIVGAH